MMGRVPSTPSFLTFLPTETYYIASVFFMPLFLMGQWLLLSAILHIMLRCCGYASDFDRILNITGYIAIIVGAVLVPWDWAYLLVIDAGPVVLGIAHLAALFVRTPV
jgi:hypothetical protein